MGKYDHATVRFAEFIIRWRWAVILLTLAVVIFAGYGSSRLYFKSDYRVWFGEGNPQLQAFETLQDVYTKQDNILFVLQPKNQRVFDKEILSAVEELTHQAWQMEFAIRVDSISNFQEIRGTDEDLVVTDLVSDAANLSSSEIRRVEAVALNEPLVADRLINGDGSITGVNVTFQMPEVEPDEVARTANAARELAANLEAKYPDIKTYLTGVVIMNTTFQESAWADIKSLVPAMFVVIFLTMFFLLRSFWGMLATALLVSFSSMVAIGGSGWANIPLNSASVAAPIIIMTICVADAIHLLSSMFSGMANGATKHEALVDSVRINAQPIFLTSITTTIGFLTMNFSDAPPFHDLGNITAVGVVVAFILSLTFIPALIATVKIHPKPAFAKYGAGLSRFAEFVIRRRTMLLAAVGIFSLTVISMIPQIELDDQFIKYFDEDIPFRADTDFTVDNLTGLYQVHFSLPAGSSNGISSPEFLNQAEEFTSWLRQHPDVVYVNSITDIFKQLNKSLHGDNEAYYKVPDDRNLAAQYFLLYELSLPYGLDLNSQVNIDKSETQVMVILGDMSSKRLRKFTATAESEFKRISGRETIGIGTSVMFSHVSKRNIEGMLVGISLGLVLISSILIFALRSLKIGLISLIPNLLPAAIAFGFWGIFVGQVNMAVSVVAAITLGIVVDDTVHFLSKYLRARREKGLNAQESVRYAFSSVGVALLVTTAVLVAGFLILGQSGFEINSAMAALTATTITIALVIDFLLLPPLLMSLDKSDEKTGDESSDQEVSSYA